MVEFDQIFHVANNNNDINKNFDIGRNFKLINDHNEPIKNRSNFNIINFKSLINSISKEWKKKLNRLFILIIVLILAISISVIIIFAFVPCSLAQCHSKASICINHFFDSECVCDYGYTGNGKQFCDECGLISKQPNLRVVGGIEAEPNSWPSSAFIITSYKTDLNFKKKVITLEASFLCGGTLVNRKTVLTAAHCILKEFEYEYKGETLFIKVVPNKYYPTLESMYKVYLGAHNRSNTKDPSQVSVSVEKIIIHEEFKTSNVLNDITILKLAKIVNLNDNIQPACLPDKKWPKEFPFPSTPAWAIGWGVMQEFGSSPLTLRNVKINIYHDSTCNRVLTHTSKSQESLLCAGDINGGKDTCQGDSGGSIFVKENVNNRTKFVSAGIVSYGDGCGKKNKPGLYTRTIYFIDWIEKNSRF